jgi:hypothetical protein
MIKTTYRLVSNREGEVHGDSYDDGKRSLL